MSTGTGRQNFTVQMERVKGNKVKEKRSLLEIFHLASVCHVGCHFNSGKQVERLHFQYGFFKNEWSHCPKKSLIGLQHMCRVIVSSCFRAVHDGDGLMHAHYIIYRRTVQPTVHTQTM